MNARRALLIEAAVTPNEEAVIVAAADVLARALTEADGQSWTCEHRFHADAGALAGAGGRSVILMTSLLGSDHSAGDTLGVDRTVDSLSL